MEGAPKNDIKDNDIKIQKELTPEEILGSNDVEFLVKYAKENRSKVAIDKVRELIELARKTGEIVVKSFIGSFKECERDHIDYLNFENTESGKVALEHLEKMPEPFRTHATKKLEDYKNKLKYNTELFKKHKNNSEAIWKDVFGFDYYNIPEAKERLKDFFFKDIQAISKDYYKTNALEAKQDPFALNFFIDDPENFNRAMSEVFKREKKDDHEMFAAFSGEKDGAHVNVFNKNTFHNTTIPHESEHAIHRHTNPFPPEILEPGRLYDNTDFEFNKEQLGSLKFDFEERLKQAKDEIFAYSKGGDEREFTEDVLIGKGIDAGYDYNRKGRDLDHKAIKNNIYLSETEKQKLRDAIDFLQSEYDRVLKNMIDIFYEKGHSVEFFRNVPINELWKYSNGKYNRTDFTIRKFGF